MASAGGQSTSAGSFQSSTLGLPAELFWMVVAHLTFADCFFLSQTATGLRRVLQRDWRGEYALCIPREQRTICRELAEGLARVWYCTVCSRLHRVHPLDFPNSPQRHSSGECSMKQELPQHSLIFRYPFQARHVQLARKYSRMRQTCGRNGYVSYLGLLMDTWSVSNGESVEFVPKYVDTQIMVQKTFTLVEGPSTPFSSLKREDLLFLSLCYHVDPHHCSAEITSPWKHFKSSLVEALGETGTEISGFCRHCPTDYRVVIEQAATKQLRVTAWCILALDPEYSEAQCKERRFIWNGQEQYYCPGMVQDAYCRSQSWHSMEAWGVEI